MCKYLVNGGNKIEGVLDIRGAKNSVLPILASTILNENKSIIHNVSGISDVYLMINILKSVGCKVSYENGTVTVDSTNITSSEIEKEYVEKMRSSIIVMGAMIGRCDYAKISYPGGCKIGDRPIDLHLKGFKKLGVKIVCDGEDEIKCFRENLVGNIIDLEFPSVGATENIMLASVKAKGKTIINNSAREPEIEDLQDFLNKMGAKVYGAGTNQIIIEGVEKLNAVEHSVIPDRIAIGTYMIASAITGGTLEVLNVVHSHMNEIYNKLELAGCEFEILNKKVIMKSPKNIQAIDFVKTTPHPGFPTDMQSQLMTLMTLSSGESIFNETIFENRFMHASELKKMGANIDILNNNFCVVKGVKNLIGQKVKSPDLRGGASLVLAGLSIFGETEIDDIYHIERGYEDFEGVLKSLGADIKRLP
ncbi:MAG: UDP-N-acetylglucosamine 1-carboxyvinyltransferase [Peptostreptococcaceae bacterium]